ncbi:Uncharacterised protein [Mycobacteroides abscessus subsp. massiliense]|nr:Uncharacterised protein [Mycobacteroides abscessus subsp. massiliense]
MGWDYAARRETGTLAAMNDHQLTAVVQYSAARRKRNMGLGLAGSAVVSAAFLLLSGERSVSVYLAMGMAAGMGAVWAMCSGWRAHKLGQMRADEVLCAEEVIEANLGEGLATVIVAAVGLGLLFADLLDNKAAAFIGCAVAFGLILLGATLPSLKRNK